MGSRWPVPTEGGYPAWPLQQKNKEQQQKPQKNKQSGCHRSSAHHCYVNILLMSHSDVDFTPSLWQDECRYSRSSNHPDPTPGHPKWEYIWKLELGWRNGLVPLLGITRRRRVWTVMAPAWHRTNAGNARSEGFACFLSFEVWTGTHT